jgi:N-carbamoyl-L-amino-acid hydrolase
MSSSSPQPDLALAGRLFAELAARTADPSGAGVCRDSYGAGEQAAHDLVAAAARDLGLELRADAALNLYATLPGERRDLPKLVVGSHLDSVMRGGNYDGAAGVIAGLSVAAGLVGAGRRLRRDLVILGIRAEEAVWFDSAYVGSLAALGMLDPGELDRVRRSDTGRTLADHMAAHGADLAALRARTPQLRPAEVEAYLEVHIEQGPALVAAGLALGVVTGVFGCARYSAARCFGAYGHSGATPRELRADAVLATAELVTRLDEAWRADPDRLENLRVTVGVLSTDPEVAGGSKVAGETRFVLDLRGLTRAGMEAFAAEAERIAAEIGRDHGVRFDLGPATWSEPAPMSAEVVRRLTAACDRLGKRHLAMPSGAGHDAAAFAGAGVPSGMLFIRNEHGSHNPAEHMAMADFADAAEVLLAVLLDWG